MLKKAKAEAQGSRKQGGGDRRNLPKRCSNLRTRSGWRD